MTSTKSIINTTDMFKCLKRVLQVHMQDHDETELSVNILRSMYNTMKQYEEKNDISQCTSEFYDMLNSILNFTRGLTDTNAHRFIRYSFDNALSAIDAVNNYTPYHAYEEVYGFCDQGTLSLYTNDSDSA